MDKETGFEQRVPARLRLYRQVVDLFRDYETAYSEAFAQKNGKPPTLDGFIPFSHERRRPLSLSDKGIDEAEFGYMITDKLDASRNGSIENHDILRVLLITYWDSSPCVLDGDVLEAIYEPDNFYYLLLGRELPPMLIQAEQLDNDAYTAQSLLDANKHYLDDAECANVLAFLQGQARNFDLESYEFEELNKTK